MTRQQKEQDMRKQLFRITLKIENQLREVAEGVLQDWELKFSTLGYDEEFEQVLQEQRLWKMKRLEQLRTKIYQSIKKAPTGSVVEA